MSVITAGIDLIRQQRHASALQKYREIITRDPIRPADVDVIEDQLTPILGLTKQRIDADIELARRMREAQGQLLTEDQQREIKERKATDSAALMEDMRGAIIEMVQQLGTDGNAMQALYEFLSPLMGSRHDEYTRRLKDFTMRYITITSTAGEALKQHTNAVQTIREISNERPELFPET